jgi:putative membrane protein
LAWKSEFLGAPWFHGKLLLAVCLSAVHGHFSVAARHFMEDKNEKSALYWRIMNEVPTLLMVGIVIFVIVKPFN